MSGAMFVDPPWPPEPVNPTESRIEPEMSHLTHIVPQNGTNRSDLEGACSRIRRTACGLDGPAARATPSVWTPHRQRDR
jgi:hypothetical protein